MNRNELLDHYDNYVENCLENEIPISFQEWEREYKNDLLIIINQLN